MHPADNPLVSHPQKKGLLKVLLAIVKRAMQPLTESTLALLPIILVIGFFQLVVLRQPIPNLGQMLWGTVLVLLGLALFVRGLEMALFPIGEEMAYNFVRKGNLWWLLVFAFTLGFGTTVAEPALIAIAEEAARRAPDSTRYPSSVPRLCGGDLCPVPIGPKLHPQVHRSSCIPPSVCEH